MRPRHQLFGTLLGLQVGGLHSAQFCFLCRRVTEERDVGVSARSAVNQSGAVVYLGQHPVCSVWPRLVRQV